MALGWWFDHPPRPKLGVPHGPWGGSATPKGQKEEEKKNHGNCYQSSKTPSMAIITEEENQPQSPKQPHSKAQSPKADEPISQPTSKSSSPNPFNLWLYFILLVVLITFLFISVSYPAPHQHPRAKSKSKQQNQIKAMR
jgi:hypothetical protein